MKLHVGHLAAGTTEKALRDAFERHGTVGAVTLPSSGVRLGKATGAPGAATPAPPTSGSSRFQRRKLI